jgi:hypothetical protein
MEKQIALVKKSDNRVQNILVVDSLDKNYIKQFETHECDVIPVKDSTPYVHGLWDGKVFSTPDNDYLKSIGLVKDVVEVVEVVDEA